jgi:Na+/proline symporter
MNACVRYFQDRVSRSICLDWLQTVSHLAIKLVLIDEGASLIFLLLANQIFGQYHLLTDSYKSSKSNNDKKRIVWVSFTFLVCMLIYIFLVTFLNNVCVSYYFKYIYFEA